VEVDLPVSTPAEDVKEKVPGVSTENWFAQKVSLDAFSIHNEDAIVAFGPNQGDNLSGGQAGRG
jgi:hypothetical protein